MAFAGPGLSCRGWLHGSRELGDGYCRRVEVWVFAAQCDFVEQFDGDVFAGVIRKVGDRHGAGSCASLPRIVFAADVDVFVGGVRDCDCGVCDLAEVLGSAVALKLLFGLPLLAGVLITSLDVFTGAVPLQGRGFRLIEIVCSDAALRLSIAAMLCVRNTCGATVVGACGGGICAASGNFAEPGDALYRDRNSGRPNRW